MRALQLAVFLLAAGCGPNASAICQGIALGSNVSTLGGVRDGRSQCVAHPFREPEGPVDDLRCCARKAGACNMTCTPEVTVIQVGPVSEAAPSDPTWCCVFVRGDVVLGRAVMYD